MEINDESRGTCNKYNEIRFKTSILRPSIGDYIIRLYHALYLLIEL